ncbi:hypothetical protein Ping_3250 [Psychromonas ingrahamii 37]|uniref:Type 4 fimbrial biogenesis protein PilX N-terminal domain-containing protein n=1 Tax=Psychromonas ingrahamii (strain DSM 17664 / CCUG 51855 / 37) TaxID=357804 RepID=A1SZM2_PSYIN|nr:ice-binding family protein [Psychromonas ingrahamii]ABM04937.1 hypothetical protein Ping_3250 [Psychromonas ingrahamii 37]
MKKHKGFVLIPILIITTISAMLAFSQLSDNRLQERVAGNQQKEISARLAAEKGIFKAFNDIKVQGDLGMTNAEIIGGLIDSGKVDLSARESYSFPSDNNGASPEATIITLVSKGEFGGATAYLKAVIKTIDDPGGLGKVVSYCSIYYYYPEQDTTVAGLESGYSEYCGAVHISPFQSYAAISGAAMSIAASSTVNGDLAAQAALAIGANAEVHNIYAGAAVSTGALSSVENIFSGAAASIGADAIAQNIHAGAAITVGADGDVQAVYAGGDITLGANASTNGVLAEDANSDDYVEAGDIHNAGNMTEMIALIMDTQSALFALEPSPENGPLLTNIGTSTLAPGVWEGSAVTIAASSTITFDADVSTNNEDHVWVINLSDALTVGASTNFEVIGLDDTDTATIIWNVGAALTMGAGTSFRGTAFVKGAVTGGTSSVSCGHLYATAAISIGSIGVDSAGNAVTCENYDAVFTYLGALMN